MVKTTPPESSPQPTKCRTQSTSQALPFCFVLRLHVPTGAGRAGRPLAARPAERGRIPAPALPTSARAHAALLSPSPHYCAVSQSPVQQKKTKTTSLLKGAQTRVKLHPSPTDIANQPLLSRPNRDHNLFENTTQTKHQKCSLLRSCGFSQRPLAFWGKGKADGSEAPKGNQTTKGTQTNQPSTSLSVKEPA